MKKHIILSLVLLTFNQLLAQQSELEIRGFMDYLRVVEAHHPVAGQAYLLDEESTVMQLKARGNLDPQVDARVEQKFFKDDNYFRFIEGDIRVPTRYGLEFNAGYDLNDGVNLNPADLLPSSGLVHVGIRLDVLRGMIYNERRAALDQARLFRTANALEKEVMLNELYASAAVTYVDWLVAREKLDIAEQYVDYANELFEGTLELYKIGDGRAIDTLEAGVALDNRINQRAEFLALEFEKNMMVSAFLWDEDGLPAKMKSVGPPVEDDLLLQFYDSLSVAMSNAIRSHPDLLALTNKGEMLKVEQRLLKEELKPRLSLQYNPFIYQWDERAFNDYKWRAGFSMPMFFREARADIQLNTIKSQQVRLQQRNLETRLNNRSQAMIREIELLEQQLTTQKSIVIASEKLANAERSQYLIGESTIFLVNQREQKWFAQRMKAIELKGKLVKKRIEIMALLNALPGIV